MSEDNELYLFSITYINVPNLEDYRVITKDSMFYNQKYNNMLEYITQNLLDNIFKYHDGVIDEVDSDKILQHFPHRKNEIQQYLDFYNGRRKFILNIIDELKMFNWEETSIYRKKLPSELNDVPCECDNYNDIYNEIFITISKCNEVVKLPYTKEVNDGV
jgi:hypothetical protein